MTRWWIWDQPTCCQIPLSMTTSLQQTRNFKLKSEQALWDIMVISTCHVIHPFLRSHWKKQNQEDIKDAECGWAPETPEWNVTGGPPDGNPLPETSCWKKLLATGPPPPPHEYAFLYPTTETPNFWKYKSTSRRGTDEGILPLGEQEKTGQRERTMGRIGTRVAGFHAPGKTYQLIKIIWIKIHLNIQTTR